MFATVREAAKAAEVSLEASNLSQLFSLLANLYGKDLGAILSGFSHDPERLVVLVNGRHVAGNDPRSVSLKEGDEVSIFPPVSGG